MPPVFPVKMQMWMSALVEWCGFDHVWLPDHVSFPDFLPCPDVWAVMAAAATKTSKTVFGVRVTDPHRVHPAVLAQRLATLDQLSQGRIVLGLGTGESMNLDAFGIPWDRRLARMKEAVQVMRALLDSDEPVTLDGEFYHLRRARLAVRPYKNRKIPLYLAALGPKAQAYAGQMADGWVPTAIPPQFYREYFEPIRQSAQQHGRDPDSIERVASLTIALVNDAAGRNRVLKVLRDHALDFIWKPVVERMGLSYSVPPEVAEVTYGTVNPFDPEQRRQYEEHQKALPDDLVERFVCVGDVARVRKMLGEYVDAGATHLDVMNASLDPTATFTIANEIIPYFRTRKAPRTVAFIGAITSRLRKVGVIQDADPDKGVAWIRKAAM